MNETVADFATTMQALGEGRAGAIAEALSPGGVSRQVVDYWLTKGHVPAEKAPLVESVARRRGINTEVEALCPGRRWVRVKDKAWPHPKGRPLLDTASEVAA